MGIAYLAGALCPEPVLGQGEPPSKRKVEVEVTAQTAEGVPVAGVPVGVVAFRGFGFGVGGTTSDKGRAVLSAEVPASTERLMVRPSNPDKMAGGVVLCQDQEEAEGLRAILRRWSFSWNTWVRLDAAHSSYQVTLTARPASTVIGTLVGSDGTPIKEKLWAQVTGLLAEGGGKNGRFEVCGLQRGAENEVLIAVSGGGRVWRMPLSAEQCGVELIDLGNILISEDAEGGRLGIVIGNRTEIAKDAVDYSLGVSVVSEDGTRAYEMWMTRPDGTAQFLSGDSLLSLPAGTYYVGPGRVLRGGGAKLWKVIRTHKPSDLENAGITKVTIAVGEVKQITLDAAAGRAAILQLGGSD